MDTATKKVLESLIKVLQDAEGNAYQAYMTAMQTHAALIATVRI